MWKDREGQGHSRAMGCHSRDRELHLPLCHLSVGNLGTILHVSCCIYLRTLHTAAILKVPSHRLYMPRRDNPCL